MTRKRSGSKDSLREARIVGSKADLKAELDEQIRKGEELEARAVTDEDEFRSLEADYHTWGEYNVDLLTTRFTSGKVAKQYKGVFAGDAAPRSFEKRLKEMRDNIGDKLRKLHSIVGRLPLYDEDVVAPTVTPPTAATTHKVFIIHGHDETALLELEKLLTEEFALEVIVLKGKAGAGRTLIEKFEDVAPDCGFAFALFTPDDFVASEQEEYFQMRPNSAFELGWFYGKLGRNRTCILLKERTKLPSDLKGIETIRFREGVAEEYLKIREELTAAGLVR